MTMGGTRGRSPAPSRQRLPVITLNKTFLLTKFNFNRKTFDSKVIYSDYTKKIKSFEVITDLNLLMLVTTQEELFRYKILEVNGKLYDEKTCSFSGTLQSIYQIAPRKVVVPVFKNSHTQLKVLDPETLSTYLTLKLNEAVPLNRIAYFDDSFLFAFVPCLSKKNIPSEKVYLFDTTVSSPRRCFMLSGSQIIDCCMPTSQNLFVGCQPNELKFFKIAFGTEKPFLFDFAMKLKARVNSLEIFHKNDNILLANCYESQRGTVQSVIFIVNTLTKETINTIRPNDMSLHSFQIKALATITILSKKPEIYLLGFGNNEIRMCDIDSGVLGEKLQREAGQPWIFRERVKDPKLVKILSQKKNGNIKFLAITESGIIMINLN
jgi:hypothetical protein